MAKLTTRQIKAIPIILEAPSLRAAAKKIGVSAKTLSRWNNEPVFTAELDRARDAMTKDALSLLQLSMEKAVKRLAKIIDCNDLGLARIAANDVLRNGLKSLEIFEIINRLEEIEKKLEEQKK